MTLDDAYRHFAGRTPEQRERGPLATATMSAGEGAGAGGADLWPAVCLAFVMCADDDLGLLAVAETDDDLDAVVRAGRRNMRCGPGPEPARVLLVFQFAARIYWRFCGPLRLAGDWPDELTAAVAEATRRREGASAARGGMTWPKT